MFQQKLNTFKVQSYTVELSRIYFGVEMYQAALIAKGKVKHMPASLLLGVHVAQKQCPPQWDPLLMPSC